MSILVTGFQPFDNRSVNASWIAAESLKSTVHLNALELPVVWGAPWHELSAAVERYKPATIISMGEGREGWFDIETLARNNRSERRDNLDALPPGLIEPTGPTSINATIAAEPLHKNLLSLGYPIRISNDAGGFLCEETLFCLELLKLDHDFIKTVTFIHLPPFDTALSINSKNRICDTDLLTTFASALLDAIRSLPDSK